MQQSNQIWNFSDNRALYEQVVRVEKELKHQKEMIKAFMYQVDKRFTFMQWMIGLGFTITIVAIAVARYLN